MPIFIFIATFLAGCLLGFTMKPNGQSDIQISRIYIVIASLLVLNAALVNFANIQHAALMNAMVFILNWGKSLNFLLIGYFLVHISQVMKSNDQTAVPYDLHKITRSCLWAITMINGFGFLIETGYKLKNFQDLVEQFRDYGYALWFLYFIIITETLGGIGVLLHFKLKTGPIAALGLMFIMLGVVYTNWHSNNPFAYSYPAVDAFLSLGFMMMLYSLERTEQVPLTVDG